MWWIIDPLLLFGVFLWGHMTELRHKNHTVVVNRNSMTVINTFQLNYAVLRSRQHQVQWISN